MHTLLLGAGASFEAKLPTTKQLTTKLLERFSAAGPSANLDVLNFVVGGLQFRAGIAGRNPIDETPDIEAVVRAIELLEGREQSEAAAFVGSWHPRIAELERAASNVFRETREQILQHLKALLWISNTHDLSYLEPLRSIIANQSVLEIATLNFDNVIETFAAQREIACGRLAYGHYYPHEGYQFTFGDRGINLMKLHGSLDWSDHQNEPVPFVLGQGYVSLDPRVHTTPALLFGTSNKLVAHGPYLELLARFQNVLRDTAMLTIVGYSFRDAHINMQIGNYMLRRRTNQLRIIDPAKLATPFVENLLRAGGAGRVDVRCVKSGVGLAEAFGA